MGGGGWGAVKVRSEVASVLRLQFPPEADRGAAARHPADKTGMDLLCGASLRRELIKRNRASQINRQS